MDQEREDRTPSISKGQESGTTAASIEIKASFSDWRLALSSIPFSVFHSLISVLVHGLNTISPSFPFMYPDAVRDVFIQSWQFRRSGFSFSALTHICCKTSPRH